MVDAFSAAGKDCAHSSPLPLDSTGVALTTVSPRTATCHQRLQPAVQQDSEYWKE
ncbi:MAG: hypothetical protein ABSG61_01370 [Gemmatimonadales bacterium]|jgi:hypothetical protein